MRRNVYSPKTMKWNRANKLCANVCDWSWSRPANEPINNWKTQIGNVQRRNSRNRKHSRIAVKINIFLFEFIFTEMEYITIVFHKWNCAFFFHQFVYGWEWEIRSALTTMRNDRRTNFFIQTPRSISPLVPHVSVVMSGLLVSCMLLPYTCVQSAP